MADVKLRRYLINVLIDDVPFEALSCAITYGVNSIPQASIDLATGRDMQTRRLQSARTGHAHLFPAASVRIYVQVLVPGGGSREVLLFEGGLTGEGLDASPRSRGLRVEAVSWLKTLDAGTILSQQVHPGSPHNLGFQGSVTPLFGDGTTASPLDTHANITPTVLETDLWGLGVLPLLEKLAGLDLVNKDKMPVQLQTQHPAVRVALARFRRSPTDGVPLRYDPRQSNAESSAKAIAQAVTNMSLAQLGSSTFWSLIVQQLCPAFLVAVIPRVEDALVVPLVGGLNRTWRYGFQHIRNLRLVSNRERPLQAVGIVCRTTNKTNAGKTPNEDAAALGLGGWFAPSGERIPGLIKLQAAPPWAEGISVEAVDTRHAVNVSRRGVVTTSYLPTAQAGRKAKATKPRSVMDALAHWHYVNEHLAPVNAVFQSYPRIDICPGSTVSFPGPAGPMVGLVGKVTFSFSSQKGDAVANYSLSHVRSANINAKSQTLLSRHPLWRDPWVGARLAPGNLDPDASGSDDTGDTPDVIANADGE